MIKYEKHPMLDPASNKRKRIIPKTVDMQKRKRVNDTKGGVPPLPVPPQKRLEQYYSLTQTLKKEFRYITLSLRQATALPNELIELILVKTLPSRFDSSLINLIITAPIDTLAKNFTESDIPKDELEAIRIMGFCAAINLIGLKKGKTYFNLQYGKTAFEQFITLIKAFGKFPREILDDPDIKTEFIDLHFVHAYNLIQIVDKSALSLLYLHCLPSNIKTLKHLKELYLFVGCKLTSLPSGIRELENLEILNLDGNLFKTIPVEIFALKNLKSLSMARNQLTIIPKDLYTLTALTDLDLSGNFFSDETLSELQRNFVHLGKNLSL